MGAGLVGPPHGRAHAAPCGDGRRSRAKRGPRLPALGGSRVPCAGPRASEQPNPPPAAGKGALNVGFWGGGWGEKRARKKVRISLFVFAPLARTIEASDQEEASCLRDREKQSVCKMDRRLAGGDGYGWLWGRRECSRRMRRAPIRKSFCRRGCRFRSSRPLRSLACRSLRFRPRADRCLAGRPTPAAATGVGDGSTSSGGGSTAGSGDAYNSMMAQSWGSSAASAAGAMGISATALAATCAMESNCQNVGSSGGSSATGAFQMISSTYNADIQGAVAYDPSIAGTIVSGSAGAMDPGTEAYAAAYELRQDALTLAERQNR